MPPRRAARACGDFEQAAAPIGVAAEAVIVAADRADRIVRRRWTGLCARPRRRTGRQMTVCDVSTVYRILLDLEQLGVARQIHIADGPALYAPEDGGQRAYLPCEQCARLQIVDATQLDRVHAETRRTLNYHAPLHALPARRPLPSLRQQRRARRHPGSTGRVTTAASPARLPPRSACNTRPRHLAFGDHRVHGKANLRVARQPRMTARAAAHR